MTNEMEVLMNSGAQIESNSQYKLHTMISKDNTYGYEISDMDLGEVIMEGDGYESEEDMFFSLTKLNEAMKCIFG